MSAAGPACPVTCSGAMYPTEPIVMPVRVSDTESSTWAMPKSITLGPLAVRITLDGLRSRCTTPAAWMSASASASPMARADSRPEGNGPVAAMKAASDGPAAYSVTRNWPLRVSAGLDHLDDAFSPDPGQRGRLAAEPGLELGVVGQFGPDDLDRDQAAVLGHAEIHDGHAARPQPGGQPVAPDPPRIAVPQRRARGSRSRIRAQVPLIESDRG